jgi:hypothetical protein
MKVKQCVEVKDIKIEKKRWKKSKKVLMKTQPKRSLQQTKRKKIYINRKSIAGGRWESVNPTLGDCSAHLA